MKPPGECSQDDGTMLTALVRDQETIVMELARIHQALQILQQRLDQVWREPGATGLPGTSRPLVAVVDSRASADVHAAEQTAALVEAAAQLGQLRRANQRLQESLFLSQQSLIERDRAHEGALREAARAQFEISVLRRSWSWRVTWPLRWVLDSVASLGRTGRTVEAPKP